MIDDSPIVVTDDALLAGRSPEVSPNFPSLFEIVSPRGPASEGEVDDNGLDAFGNPVPKGGSATDSKKELTGKITGERRQAGSKTGENAYARERIEVAGTPSDRGNSRSPLDKRAGVQAVQQPELGARLRTTSARTASTENLVVPPAPQELPPEQPLSARKDVPAAGSPSLNFRDAPVAGAGGASASGTAAATVGSSAAASSAGGPSAYSLDLAEGTQSQSIDADANADATPAVSQGITIEDDQDTEDPDLAALKQAWAQPVVRPEA